MHGQAATHARSVWADLDAIVLQEVKALRAASPRPAEIPFGSDEEFMDRAAAYLEGRGDEAHILMERLRSLLGLTASAATDQAEALQEPAHEGGIDDVPQQGVMPADAASPGAEHEQET
ncbi:hypothetical protein [Mesorhizobium japonicum]|uniref:Mll6879 protein n=1 Tax=Mesorhizobium japonicum (strain LMG 29417 / CECT 9101 / MAFF 303099) TaxID=266835 RepID=Q987W5_RHILO|nr:hypothetical protein [Mesorhizobium japonicum]BAB53085.1 mll6879 [Mesorhizobium japonicum MAFF 303099]